MLVHACRRDIAWVIALIPRTRTDIRKYLCREKKKEGRKKKKKGKKKKVETKKPHPPRFTFYTRYRVMQAKPRAIVPHFLSFRRLLRNLGFPFLPSPPPSRFLFSPEGKKFEATLRRSPRRQVDSIETFVSLLSPRRTREKLGEDVQWKKFG